MKEHISAPEISVIVPVYNVEKYLNRCIDSILAQTFPDIEVILVDDGSTDNSGKICDDYSRIDDRIVVYHKENGGVSSARNYGMHYARGKYIAFIDADDYISQNYYKKLIDCINTNEVVFSHYSIEKKGEIVRIYQKNLKKLIANPLDFNLLYKKTTGKWLGDLFIGDNIDIFCVRAIYRREFLERNTIYFDQSLRSGEDRIFVETVLLHAEKIAVADDEFGYFYFMRGEGSITFEYSITSYKKDLFNRFKYMDIAEQNVCNNNVFLTRRDRRNIRMFRAAKMRSAIIINEFKYNSLYAVEEIRKLYKEDLFKFAFTWRIFFCSLRSNSTAENLKFLFVKLHLYNLLIKIYKKRMQ